MRFPTAGFRAHFFGESRGLHMRRFGLLGIGVARPLGLKAQLGTTAPNLKPSVYLDTKGTSKQVSWVSGVGICT